MSKKGFTLVEIMIVVAIIGLLAAIAIPAFVRARTTSQRNACINNLRQVAGAIDQWAIETGQAPDAAVVEAEVATYIKGGMPTCPVGNAVYGMTTVNANPTCGSGIADHTLPPL